MWMTSSVYKFKMATRQNLARTKSCSFSIGWHFVLVLQYGKDKSDAQKRWERWVLCSREARRALAEKGWRPPSPVHHPSPARRPLPTKEEERKQMEVESRWRKQGGWRMWEDPHHCCQPNSWPRWLQGPGHLHQVRRSQSGGSSDLPWEAKPPRRNSSRLERSKRPEGTTLAQLLFGRSSSSKRALSSSSENSPSHS